MVRNKLQEEANKCLTQSTKDLRLAVLIDAIMPKDSIKAIMAEIAVYGTPTIKRIYL